MGVTLCMSVKFVSSYEASPLSGSKIKKVNVSLLVGEVVQRNVSKLEGVITNLLHPLSLSHDHHVTIRG